MKDKIVRSFLSATARALLLIAAGLLLAAVVVAMLWWRLVTYPYRKANGGKQASWKTQLELAGAVAASVAALYYSLRPKREPEPAPEPAPAAKPVKVPAEVRVRGVTFRNPDEALVHADELEWNAQELVTELRQRGKDPEADAIADRAHRDAERLREWAHAASAARQAA